MLRGEVEAIEGCYSIEAESNIMNSSHGKLIWLLLIQFILRFSSINYELKRFPIEPTRLDFSR
jgi:hypothetical protein